MCKEESTPMENTKKKLRGKRGQGSVYRPQNSRFWWVKFSIHGRVIQESAETESRREALDVLKARILKYSTGVSADSRQTTVKDVSEEMLKTWRMLEKTPASIAWADRCWRHLLEFFGTMKADAISSAAIRGYAEFRRKEKASNATINRELAVMSSGYTIAYEETPRRVAQKLSFSRLAEPRARQGFIEQAQYLKLSAGCKELFMRTMLALAYTFGFRKGELLSLKVSDVDLMAGTVRLRTSKNGEPRQVNLTAETRNLLAACIAGKSGEEPVFTRGSEPVRYFGQSWDTIAASAGCPGLLFHDLRRSAVRNLIRAGVPETVCMKISGHKTRAIFDRYNITSARDLADAAQKLEISYRQAKIEEPQADESVTIQ
jgi:integrase